MLQGGAAGRPVGRVVTLLQDNIVRYNNQPIGVAIAETFEQAVDAANRVRVLYDGQPAKLDMDREKKNAYAPHQAGRGAPTRAAATSTKGSPPPTPRSTPFTPRLWRTTTRWSRTAPSRFGMATTSPSTTRPRASSASRAYWRISLRIPPKNVRCVTYFTGGGFGCKGSTWSHTPLAAIAAQAVGRPVKLEVTRSQMFGMVGYRPRTEQHIQLGATRDGALTASRHDCHSQTSTFEDFVEPSALSTRMLYAVPNQVTSHRLIRLNYGTPTFMRAPGESSGTFAIETAMDELAYALKMDPVDLRLKNYAETDPDKNLPWSLKSLRECYRQGAERFRLVGSESRTTVDARCPTGVSWAGVWRTA